MSAMRRYRIVLLAAATVLLSWAALGPAPAVADQGPSAGSTPGGYKVAVVVVFSGDAAPGGGSSRRIGVQPSCWWAPAPGPYTDAGGMLDWYDRNAGAIPDQYTRFQYGDRDQWKKAADGEKAGRDVSWYRAVCQKPEQYLNFVSSESRVFDADPLAPQVVVVSPFRPFGVGQPLPPPLVDPADLARAARDVMVIPVPELERNPRLRSAGAPTIMGLPTWFWVPDPAAVGGAAGTRTIRATTGAVFAEVVARTEGLQISSPAGGTTCPPARATVAYAKGVPDSSACTVAFSKASVGYPGGYPVTASTAWTATWTGSGGTGGTLDPLARSQTTAVPVAEVQNVVTR
jgi:hypothetical protein